MACAGMHPIIMVCTPRHNRRMPSVLGGAAVREDAAAAAAAGSPTKTAGSLMRYRIVCHMPVGSCGWVVVAAAAIKGRPARAVGAWW